MDFFTEVRWLAIFRALYVFEAYFELNECKPLE